MSSNFDKTSIIHSQWTDRGMYPSLIQGLWPAKFDVLIEQAWVYPTNIAERSKVSSSYKYHMMEEWFSKGRAEPCC